VFDGSANRVAVAHVEAQSDCSLPGLRQIAGDGDGLFEPAAGDGYVSAAGAQTLGNNSADATISTGDKGDLAAEIE
jgi:hypothetical protein